MYCDGCGVRLYSDARFCGACGAAAPEVAGPVACACGATLEPGAHFCERCGMPVAAPARPVAGGVSDARLSGTPGAALPAAGARVLGPSRRAKRNANLPVQSAVGEAALVADGLTSITANVPIGPSVRVVPEVPAVPVVSTGGGTRVQMGGATPSAPGPSPLVLGVIFVGSFLVVTVGLVAAYSRALPGGSPPNGSRVASRPSGMARTDVIPAAGEMLRDVRVLQIAAERRAPGLTASLAFDPAGDLVAACSRDGVLRIWSVISEREVRPLRGAASSGTLVCASAFSPERGPDGSFLALAEVGPPAQVSVFRLTGKRNALRIPTAASPVAIAAIAGRRLRVVVRGGAIATWEVDTGRVDGGSRLLPWEEEDGLPEVLTLSLDGEWLARASGPGVDVWNVERGGLPARVEMEGRPSSLAFRGDGRYLAASVSGEIGIWNIGSGRKERSFEGHRYSVSAVAFSPDGRLLGSVAESEVAIWDVLSGRMRDRVTLPGETFRSVGFNAAGTWLGAGSDDRIRLYRAR